MQYRKKPVVIDAWPVADLNRAATNDWQALPEPIREAYELGGWVFELRGISVPTLEGPLFVQSSDWIIMGIKGEFYPCKPDIFEATYELVDEVVDQPVTQ